MEASTGDRLRLGMLPYRKFVGRAGLVRDLSLAETKRQSRSAVTDHANRLGKDRLSDLKLTVRFRIDNLMI